MKFLVDNQLPLALVRYLTSRGIDAQHVIELKFDTVKDREIWKFAEKENYVVISKDEDFLHLSKQGGKVPFVWVRLGNCRTATLLAAFERIWPELELALREGERVIEVR